MTGAAAGPVFIMVDQLQYMSVVGRIGGGTSAANKAFSEEFGLFNFEILPNFLEKETFKNPLARRRQVHLSGNSTDLVEHRMGYGSWIMEWMHGIVGSRRQGVEAMSGDNWYASC